MCCIPDNSCTIMSRAKSRGVVDTCGDCGLQGLIELQVILLYFHFFSALLKMPLSQVLIEVSNQSLVSANFLIIATLIKFQEYCFVPIVRLCTDHLVRMSRLSKRCVREAGILRSSTI